MNPDTVIRPWLHAYGAQLGVNEVHERQWTDESARQVQPYMTYQIVKMEPYASGIQSKKTASGYDATFSALEPYVFTVLVAIYNSQNGMYELAAASIAAKHHPDIKKIFRTHGGAFVRVIDIRDNTKLENDKYRYAMAMVCEFTHNVEYSISSTNAVVESISVQVNITE